jgi:hypothetical protein
MKCERIWSLVFLMKFDYQPMFSQLKEGLQVKIQNENEKISKLLSQFLVILG